MSHHRLFSGSSLTVLMLAAAALTAGCSGSPPGSPAEITAAPPEPDLVILDPDTVPQGSLHFDVARTAAIPQELQVTGRIGVNENLTSRVGALVGGRVARVAASAGDRVEKGALLAQISSHEVHDARSEYAQAVTEMQRRRAELEFSRIARDRAARLYELKAASLEQVQRSEADLRTAELAVTSAQAEINRVGEFLRHLGISPESAVGEYTKAAASGESHAQYEEEELVPVPSPIAGTVMERMASPGMVVTTSNDLFVVSDLSTLWVNAEVPEKNLAAIRVGRQVGVTVQAYPGVTFPARISLVGAALNPNTRTVQVRCEISDARERLKPEMYAGIRIELGDSRDATVVPAAAIQDIDGQSRVFVRESSDRFRARQVRLGRQAGDQVEIVEGIKPGETVVTTGSFLLKSELLKRRFSVE